MVTIFSFDHMTGENRELYTDEMKWAAETLFCCLRRPHQSLGFDSVSRDGPDSSTSFWKSSGCPWNYTSWWGHSAMTWRQPSSINTACPRPSTSRAQSKTTMYPRTLTVFIASSLCSWSMLSVGTPTGEVQLQTRSDGLMTEGKDQGTRSPYQIHSLWWWFGSHLHNK